MFRLMIPFFAIARDGKTSRESGFDVPLCLQYVLCLRSRARTVNDNLATSCVCDKVVGILKYVVESVSV